jgi:uncharacterized protein YqgC (DUF456 family)
VDGVTVAAGLIILVGLVGIVVPVLPGLVLVWGAILLWALERQQTAGWFALAAATVLFALGMVAKYALPGRRLRDAGVPWWTVAAGGVLAVVGLIVALRAGRKRS